MFLYEQGQAHRLLKKEYASTPWSLNFAGAVYETDVSNRIARIKQSDV